MAPTVHKPVHMKTKQQEVTATVSSAEIHITCCLMNIDIIDDNNEKTRPIYSKNIMNQISHWQNRRKFSLFNYIIVL